MKLEDQITEAIKRSISHNEIVHVEVDSIAKAASAVSVIADDCDDREEDGGTDIWGSVDGEDFRLRLTHRRPLTDYSEYTVKNSTEPSFYGPDCTQEDANRIAASISALIRSQFPGINVEEWTDNGKSSATTGPDQEIIDEIGEWIANNWTAAL